MSPQFCCSKLICCLVSRFLKTRGEDFIERCPGEFSSYTTVPSVRRTLLQTAGNPRLTPQWWNPAQSLGQGRAEWAAWGGQQAQTSLPRSGTQSFCKGRAAKISSSTDVAAAQQGRVEVGRKSLFHHNRPGSPQLQWATLKFIPESPQDSSFGGEVWYKSNPFQSSLSSLSNLQRPHQPNQALHPCVAFFVPSFPTLQLPSSKGWHLPCSCLSPKDWNLSVAFHSHNEGITSGSSFVPSHYTLTAWICQSLTRTCAVLMDSAALKG